MSGRRVLASTVGLAVDVVLDRTIHLVILAWLIHQALELIPPH